MALLELLIGISIGFALGIIIMIFSQTRNDNSEQNLLFGRDELEEQIHESGFIDIPVHRLVFQPRNKNRKDKSNLTSIERFKLRNRFYR